MKIAETNTTIGALIERLEQTGKPLATKVRAFILIEPDQSQEDVREAVERFRMGFKDIPSEEIEQVIVESRRVVRKNTGGTVGSSLDHLIGTWTAEEAAEVNNALKDFEQTVEQYVSLIPAVKHSPKQYLWSSYDAEADVLYVNFKKPSHADDSELTDDDVIIRYDQGQVVGLTILHASQRILEDKK